MLADCVGGSTGNAAVAARMFEPAGTASGSCGENLSRKQKNGTLMISGTGSMYNFQRMSTLWNEGLSVFDNSEPIQKKMIGEGVTGISDYAFCKCADSPNGLQQVS